MRFTKISIIYFVLIFEIILLIPLVYIELLSMGLICHADSEFFNRFDLQAYKLSRNRIFLSLQEPGISIARFIVDVLKIHDPIVFYGIVFVLQTAVVMAMYIAVYLFREFGKEAK